MKKEILIESERIKEIMGIKPNENSIISEQKVLIDIFKGLIGTMEKDEYKSIIKYFKGEAFDEADRKLLSDFLKTNEGKRLVGLMRQEVAKMSDDNVKRKLLYRLRNLETISSKFGQQIKDATAAAAEEASKKSALEAEKKVAMETLIKGAEGFYNEIVNLDFKTILKDPLKRNKIINNINKLKSLSQGDQKEIFSKLSEIKQEDAELILKSLKEKSGGIFRLPLTAWYTTIGRLHSGFQILFFIVVIPSVTCGFTQGIFKLVGDVCYYISQKIRGGLENVTSNPGGAGTGGTGTGMAQNPFIEPEQK